MSTTIFEALRESHERQRSLGSELLATRGASPERLALFQALREELACHALAEERHFYLPLMQRDGGVDLSRHAIAEHHEIDELVEDLEATEASSPGWLAKARKLVDEVEHHLKEEETRFFQMAGKLLPERDKTRLARAYREEFESAKATA